MNQLVICFLLAISTPLMAGSADAVIRGRTESGRTELEVRVGDIDGILSSVKLRIDGESYVIKAAEDLQQVVVRDQKNHVYFLVVNARGRQFRLWMVPNSERIIEEGSGFYRSRFAAVLEGTDPRKEKNGQLTPRITIGCTLDWKI